MTQMSTPAAPGATNPPPARPGRGFVPLLGAANFGAYLALLTPVLVGLSLKVTEIAGDDKATALGLVTGVGALFALFANPLIGRLSDRTASRLGMRRPWILGGAVVGVAALALIGAAHSVWVVLVGWCLAQTAFNAVLAAANATIPDQVPERERGRASGVVGVGTPLAIVVGSWAVNLLDSSLARFLVPGALGGVLAVLFALALRDRRLAQAPAGRLSAREFFGSFVFDPRAHPDFGWVWLGRFAMFFGYAGIAAYLLFYLTDELGLSESRAVGVIALANTAAAVLMMASSLLGGVLSDRLGARKPFVALASVVMAVGLLLLAFAPGVATVVVAQAVIGLGFGAFMSVDMALATSVLPNPDEAAKDLGVLNIANALPQSIAPAVAPAVIAAGAHLPIGGYSTWYLLGAIVVFAGAACVFRVESAK